MLRTSITISLLLCCCVLYADDASTTATAKDLPVPPTTEPTVLPENWTVELMPAKRPPNTSVLQKAKSLAKTLGQAPGGAKLKPVVHVNSAGIEGHYGGAGSVKGAANRLRSARDSVFLPSTTKAADLKAGAKTATVKTNDAIESILGTSSRRKKELPAGQVGAPKIVPAGQAAVEETATKLPGKLLPSVVTKRHQPEPKSEPVATSSPKVTQPIALTGPTLAQPKATEPQLAEPILAEPEKTLVATPQQPKPPGIAPILEAPNQPKSTASDRVVVGSPRLAELPRDRATLSTPIQLNPGVPFTDINVPTADPTSRVAAEPVPITEVSPKETSNSLAKPLNAAATPQVRKPKSSAQNPTEQKTVSSPAEDGTELLSNRSPVLVVKTHGQSTIRVGRVSTYYITAANAGDLAAQDVMVNINVPNWAELTRNHASAGMVRIEPSTDGDNVMRWSIRDLKPASKQRLRIDLIPRASRSIELGVTWNFKSVSATAQIEVQEPKLELSVVGPSDIQHGETKLYTITIGNPGTGDAENVVLTLLPINDGSGTAGTRDIGSITAGTRRTIEVELTAKQAGDLAVRASVTGDGGLHAEGEQAVRVRRANLVVEAVGPVKKYAGTPARYAIKVTNNGDATAHEVVAVAALPMASQYVKSSNAGTYDEERGRVHWSIGSLRPGAYQIVDVTTVLMGSGSNRLDVRTAGANRLTAAGNVVTNVESQADLKLSVEDPAGVISLETEMVYEVHVVNRGTKAATNVNVVGYFSEGIEPIAVRGWKADVEVGQIIMQTIPRISPGQDMVVKVIAQAHKAGNHVFRAELDSKDPQTKLAVEEWTVFAGEEGYPSLEGPAIQQADSDSAGVEPQIR